MAYKPLSQDYLQNGLNQYVSGSQQPVVEEKGWGERIKDDIVNTVGNYFTGAQQGINEMARAQDAQMGNPLGQMYSGEGYQPPSDETNQWSQDAQRNFLNETGLPTLAVVPGGTLPAIGTMLAGGASNTYSNTDGTMLDRAGNAIRSVTYGPAVDMYNDPNLAQEFHDRPVSTLASGAMAVGQAVLPFLGARRGVQKAGELKNDLVSHVESRLNEITDNPPLQNIGIRGLDALDQLDSPTRGFRPANAQELAQATLEERNTVGTGLTNALEQIKGQKFDQANQQSYFDYMRRQEAESNGLQAQKNDIAGSVLMSPLDRMEVGADLPVKTSLGGQGRLLNETIEPRQLIVPKQEHVLPQRQIESQRTLPSAMDLVNDTQKRLFDERLKTAVNERNYPVAEQLASRMKQEGIETPLSRSVESQRNGNRLYSGLDPTGGRFDNVDLGLQARQAASKLKDRIVSTTENDRIIDNSRGSKLPPVKKMIEGVYQQVFDSLDPITRYDKEVYKSARLANGAAVGKAESIIRNKNNPMSFENITKPVHNRIDDFAEYMVAVRAKELHETGTLTGVSNTKIAKIIKEAPPEFANVQKQLAKYSDGLLDTLVDSGMVSKEHAANMRNKYESYAPMMRAFDVEEISRMFRDRGDLGKPIQNIEGSTSKVINPIESILKNTYTFNMIAETNKVRQQVASLAESFPDEIKILKNGEAAEKGTGTFDFFVDGKKHTMQLEPRLFEAIASMDSQQAGIVVSVLSKPASWLRAGATLSPEFMAKNLIRDTIGASIVGKGFTPFVDSIRGLKSAWNKDADYWRYKEEGGALGHLTGLDRNHMQEMLDNYRSKNKIQKAATVFNPSTWLDVLRKGQELSEDATRIGYYKKRLSKGDSPHEAAFEARDLLDFGRSGNWTREANKVAAFLNASLQGTDKLRRSMKERPLETSANIMKYLILPSMAVWYMGKDNEQIKELPRYVRDMFWVIPAGDKLIRIPKPFEAGVLFATGTERAMEANFGKSKEPFKGYGESLWDVTIPNLLPTALIPLGEWWANKSLFTGQPIVPMKEQNLPDNLQYGAYTTNVAKFIGDKTGQSPRKIDNTIRSLTGGAGTAVTSAIDKITGGNGTVLPTQTASDMPVVKAFIADPRKSQQSTNDFYDELDKYTKKYQAESIRKVKMTPTEKKNYQSLNNANTALKALNKEERKIIESTSLSPDAKRAKLDKIIDMQTKLVQVALKKIK
jgi:hypothetical protein